MSYTKPSLGASIDGTNTATSGLVLACLLNEGSGTTITNLVDASTATLGDGWAWGTGATGCPAIVGDGTQAETYFTPTEEQLGDSTVLVIGQNNANLALGGVTGAFFQQGVTLPHTSGVPGWSLRLVNSYASAQPPYPDIAVIASHDAGTGRVVLLTTFDTTTQTITAYDGGTSVATANTGEVAGTPLRDTATKRWYIGQTDGNPAGFHSLDGSLELVLLWNRKLSGAEITAVMADPYALFTSDAPNITSVGNLIDSLQIDWAAFSGATGYKLYRSTTPGAETLYQTLGNVTSYLDQCLTPGQAYYYRLSAILPCGDTGLSVERTGTPLILPAPTNLTATAGDREVMLAWTAEPSATSYHVYRGTSHIDPSGTATATDGVFVPAGQGTLDSALIATVTDPEYDDLAVTNGITYYYRVASVNTCGEGDITAEVSATPECCLGEWQSAPACDTAYREGAACDTTYSATPSVTTTYRTNECP